MVTQIERSFGEKFLKSIDNFYTYGIDWLFNECWETAPADVIAKYEAAILDHPAMREWERQALTEDWREVGHEEELAACGTITADYRHS